MDHFFDEIQETLKPYSGDFLFDAETCSNAPNSPVLFPFHDSWLIVDTPTLTHRFTMVYPFKVKKSISQVWVCTQAPYSSLGPYVILLSSIASTGASLGITFDLNVFDGPLTKPEGGLGPVIWTFRNGNKNEVQIRSNCYNVPKAKVRLLGPQRLFNHERGVGGKFEGNESTFKLIFDKGGPTLTILYNKHNQLPIRYAIAGQNVNPPINPQANVLLLNDYNQNLTSGQKLLLQLHARFGHLNFRRVQSILHGFPFAVIKYSASASKKCDTATVLSVSMQKRKVVRLMDHKLLWILSVMNL